VIKQEKLSDDESGPAKETPNGVGPPVIRVKQEFNEVDESSRQSSDTVHSGSRDPRQRSARRDSPPSDRRRSNERPNRATSRDRRERDRSRDRIRDNRDRSRERPPFRPRFDPRERRNDLPWRRSRSPSPDRNRNRNFHQKNPGQKKSFLEEMQEKFPDMDTSMADAGPPPNLAGLHQQQQAMPPMMNPMMYDANGMPMMNPMMNGFTPGPVPPPGYPGPNMPGFPPNMNMNMPNMNMPNMPMFNFGPGGMNGPSPVGPPGMMPGPILPPGTAAPNMQMPMHQNMPVQRQPPPQQNASDPRLRSDPRPGTAGPSGINFDFDEVKKKVRVLFSCSNLAN
jgi:hypothetical protein